MKILDRTILANFFLDLLVLGFLLTGLYVLVDSALQLDEFLETSPETLGALRNLGTYVLANLPLVVLEIAPLIILAAALHTLSTMARDRELLVLRCGGISPLRIGAPILAAALVLSGLELAVQELYVPGRMDRLFETQRLRRGGDKEEHRRLVSDGSGNLFYFERYASRDSSFRGLWVDLREGGSHVRLHAARGRWVDRDGSRVLVLRDVDRRARREGDVGYGRPEWLGRLELRTDLAPMDVEEPEARLRFESLRRLTARAERSPRMRHRCLLEIHRRIAHFLFTNWILLLIGIPFATRLREGARVLGVLLTVVIAAAYFTVSQFSAALGDSGHVSPILAAWFPVALFGALGVCVASNSE